MTTPSKTKAGDKGKGKDKDKAVVTAATISSESPAGSDNNGQLAVLVAEQVQETLYVLFAWRCLNAFACRTFFQPDEYYQALEPAWQMVFGPDSGAWLTWVRLPICATRLDPES